MTRGARADAKSVCASLEACETNIELTQLRVGPIAGRDAKRSFGSRARPILSQQPERVTTSQWLLDQRVNQRCVVEHLSGEQWAIGIERAAAALPRRQPRHGRKSQQPSWAASPEQASLAAAQSTAGSSLASRGVSAGPSWARRCANTRRGSRPPPSGSRPRSTEARRGWSTAAKRDEGSTSRASATIMRRTCRSPRTPLACSRGSRSRRMSTPVIIASS